jgi:hypothetical protein
MMVEFDIKKLVFETAALMAAAKKATARALKIAGFEIRKSAIESIESVPTRLPSFAGQPPHTHKGNYLKRAILYSVDEAEETAVIGPSIDKVGTSGKAHEFGGDYKGTEYPARPFMGPALKKNLRNIPLFWTSQINS